VITHDISEREARGRAHLRAVEGADRAPAQLFALENPFARQFLSGESVARSME
jgi:hypothetical protein